MWEWSRVAGFRPQFAPWPPILGEECVRAKGLRCRESECCLRVSPPSPQAWGRSTCGREFCALSLHETWQYVCAAEFRCASLSRVFTFYSQETVSCAVAVTLSVPPESGVRGRNVALSNGQFARRSESTTGSVWRAPDAPMFREFAVIAQPRSTKPPDTPPRQIGERRGVAVRETVVP